MHVCAARTVCGAHSSVVQVVCLLIIGTASYLFSSSLHTALPVSTAGYCCLKSLSSRIQDRAISTSDLGHQSKDGFSGTSAYFIGRHARVVVDLDLFVYSSQVGKWALQCFPISSVGVTL